MGNIARGVPTLVLAFALAGLFASRAGAFQDKPAGQNVSSGAVRYLPDQLKGVELPPSIAISVEQLPRPGKTSQRAAPSFFVAPDGRFGARIATDANTSLYGTGEVPGPLLRNGKVTVCWNTDAYGYTEANPSLYQSHPWVMGVRGDGSAFGVLADTTWRCTIDLRNGIEFLGEGAPFPVYVIDAGGPRDVMAGLAALVGKIPLPPKWALGYHQCRYSYNPESRVREIAEGFRSRKIPCDVIWFDIDYMDGYRVFTFDSTQFPDPKKLNSDLGQMGFERIWMIDPGVKAEPGYFVYDQMAAKNLWVTNAANEPFRGDVWPGVCVFPDYTSPDVRTWWAGLYKDFMATGISGVWNDMNEPAVFNVPSKTMPEDNLHRGGAWDYGGTLPPGPHLQYHNVYGLLMAKGTFDGIKAARPDKRPFVLTRAGFIGSQRYAATWTGDNSAEWDDLEDSISMALNLGLSGQPFSGPDIGGFNGNGPGGAANGQLFARWMGIGALLPFARGHTGKGNIDKEPWSFGPEVERTCRLALERRYRLMPYLYTLFHEASESGMPVARPLFFADPEDPALRSEDDAFLLGDDLLVVAKVTPLGDRETARPKGRWARVELVGEGNHPDLPELYIRSGAIIPCGPVMEWTTQKRLDPLTLLVNLNDQGLAQGVLYEDDGDGFAYAAGKVKHTLYTAVRATDGALYIRAASSAGDLEIPTRKIQVILIAPDGTQRVIEGDSSKDIIIPAE